MTTAIDIHGTCNARFGRVKDAFADNWTKHGEGGASLSVVADGEAGVDLWGGSAGARRGPGRGSGTPSVTPTRQRRVSRRSARIGWWTRVCWTSTRLW